MWGVALSLIFALSNSVVAGTVTDEIRLDSKNGSMAFLKVLDQGDTLTCYAHTAAQLIDAYRFSHGDQQFHHRTSPLGLVAGANDENDFWHDSGDTCPAVKHVVDHGSCNSLDILPGVEEEATGLLKKLKRSYEEYQHFIEVKHSIYQLIGEGKAVSDITCTFSQKWIPTSGIPPEGIIKEALNQENLILFFKKILQSSCKNHTLRFHDPIQHQLLQCQETGTQTDQGMIDVLHSRMHQPNSQPVSIGYCSHMLEGGSLYKGVISRDGTIEPKVDGSCGKHASLIIGERKFNGKLQFLLQNSWGKEACEQYNGSLIIDQHSCREGKLWIDAAILARNTFSTAFIPQPTDQP
ncbi:hypothetical protein WDW37_17435 [Bdellovibrionota bacterium FG-1]